MLDWIGCALAGSRHGTIDTLVAVLEEAGGRPQATVLGRGLKLGRLDAPLANGQMGHVLDFDDTHMGGVVLHASSPILPALFALAERTPVTGADLMLAYAVGFEAGIRVGLTAPGHHKGGWHLTGTLGTIAAAAAAGKLIGLDAQKLTYVMGIAATQAAGMQQNRGTMCKSFHAGKAAQNGVLAALLAEKGFDSTQEIIEGKRGFCRIYSDTAEPERLTAGFGESWLIETNGHKPYACGVVLHPLIDAVIALRNRAQIDPAAVSAIELRVHPWCSPSPMCWSPPPGCNRNSRSYTPPPWRWSMARPASRNIPMRKPPIPWWRRCAARPRRSPTRRCARTKPMRPSPRAASATRCTSRTPAAPRPIR